MKIKCCENESIKYQNEIESEEVCEKRNRDSHKH